MRCYSYRRGHARSCSQRRQQGHLTKLLITKKGRKQLIVDYHSKRRMSGVAVGIIKGIAKYLQESDLVEVIRLTPADEERVRIKVKFS